MKSDKSQGNIAIEQ